MAPPVQNAAGMANDKELLVELHSRSCRCRGVSYVWRVEARFCPCNPQQIPDDAIVLRIADWLFLRKPRTSEDSTTHPRWHPQMALERHAAAGFPADAFDLL